MISASHSKVSAAGVGITLMAAAGGLSSVAHAQWTNSGGNAVLSNPARGVGIGTSNPQAPFRVVTNTATPYAAWIQNFAPDQTALFGYAGGGGDSRGVWGYSEAPFGTGVIGQAASATGQAVGVRGLSNADNGFGGFFQGKRFGIYSEVTGMGGYAAFLEGTTYVSANLGVGTANPAAKLHVYGFSAPAELLLESRNGAGNAATVRLRSDESGDSGIYSPSGSNDLRLFTNNNDRLSIDNVGNIGIGTNPVGGTILTVNGVTNLDGNLTIGGTATAMGAVTAPSFAGDGSALTALAAGNITSGTLADGRLSSNIALRDAANTFTSLRLTNSGGLGPTIRFDAASHISSFTHNILLFEGQFSRRLDLHTDYFHVNGSLSKAGGSFKIDHPLDPENKFLYHSFVESPDMKNIYDGTVATDARGYATVTLPDYFEALNRDFRYQLTVIDGNDDATWVLVKVAREIEGNQFVIRSSTPETKVSWQVTGIRKDAWAEKNRIPNAVEKTGKEKGKYLYPAAYDKPAEMGIDYYVAPKNAQPAAKAAGTSRE